MKFDYHRIKNWDFPAIEQTYTEKDTMLYALALGYGSDPLDAGQLQFVYERGLQAVPTMAVVLGHPGLWIQDPESGIDWVRVLHGEQNLVIHEPLPVAATIIGRTRVTHIVDKGADKGALLAFETQVSDKTSGKLLATVGHVYYCRGNGGYSAEGQPSDDWPSTASTIPSTPADIVSSMPTRPETAVLYRLCGDLNPLHADPAIAREAGFPRPILHGLATFGVAARAILETCCDYDAKRLTAVNARFSAPVFPGETISTEIWRRGEEVLFRSRSLERDTIVLNNGYARVCC